MYQFPPKLNAVKKALTNTSDHIEFNTFKKNLKKIAIDHGKTLTSLLTDSDIITFSSKLT